MKGSQVRFEGTYNVFTNIYDGVKYYGVPVNFNLILSERLEDPGTLSWFSKYNITVLSDHTKLVKK